MCTSWDIRYSSSSRPPYLIFHPPWCRHVLKFVPLRCSMQNICGFRWNFTYILSPMSALSVSGLTSVLYISGWTLKELCTGRCCYQQRQLQHLQKQTKQRWNCFQRWFTPFDSMVTKFITFSQKHHPHHLHFRWRNSITGWTISKILASFHQALMALEIRRSAMENSDGQLRYSRKWRGCNFAPPPRCSRVSREHH